MPHPRFVYLNDRVVPWDDGKVHVASVGFKFGTGVFEGLRGYWNADREQMFVLQLAEHMQRIEFSQKFMRFDEILPGPAVGEKVLELLRANEFRENVHVMATVFVEGFGPPSTTGPIGLAILAGPRHDIPRTETGCSAQISSWQRVADTAMPMRVKCNANYQNGRLATLQAQARRLRHRHPPQQPRQGRGRSGDVLLHDPRRQGGDPPGDQRHPGEHHPAHGDDAVP